MGKFCWLVKAESRVYNLYLRDIRASCRLHSSSKPNPCGLKLVFLTFLLSQTSGHVRSNSHENFISVAVPLVAIVAFLKAYVCIRQLRPVQLVECYGGEDT